MKLLKKLLLAAVALLAVGIGSVPLLTKNLLSRERLVAELQKALNCKAEVAEFDVSLLSFPAQIEARKITLSPTDASATNSGVSVDLLRVNVSLIDLVFKKISVESILLSGVYVKDEISKDGRSPLSEMFGKAEDVDVTVVANDAPAHDQQTSVASPKTDVSDKASPSTSPSTQPGEEPQAAALPPALKLNEALIENATIHIVDRRAFTKTDAENLRIRVFNTDIDPSDLANHNSCNLELSGQLKVMGRKIVGDKGVDVKVAELSFLGTGTAVPMDPVTGLPSPKADIGFSVKKGSTLGGHLTFGEAAGKDDSLDKLKEYLGVDLSPLPLGGVLQNDLKALLRLEGSRLEWLDDTRLEFPDYAFLMQKGSWTDTEHQESRQQVSVLPSKAISDNMLAGIKARYGDSITQTALKVFGTPEGTLRFDLLLTGPPNKPKPNVTPDTMNRAIQALGGDLLKGLIGK